MYVEWSPTWKAYAVYYCMCFDEVLIERDMNGVTMVVMSLPDCSPDCPRLDFPVNEMSSKYHVDFLILKKTHVTFFDNLFALIKIQST